MIFGLSSTRPHAARAVMGTVEPWPGCQWLEKTRMTSWLCPRDEDLLRASIALRTWCFDGLMFQSERNVRRAAKATTGNHHEFNEAVTKLKPQVC